jgi:hypothetical protein
MESYRSVDKILNKTYFLSNATFIILQFLFYIFLNATKIISTGGLGSYISIEMTKGLKKSIYFLFYVLSIMIDDRTGIKYYYII